MTWYFDPDGDTVDIYDHTGTPVATDQPFAGSWSGYPAVVETVALEEIRSQLDSLNNDYATRAAAELAADDIEEGTP